MARVPEAVYNNAMYWAFIVLTGCGTPSQSTLDTGETLAAREGDYALTYTSEWIGDCAEYTPVAAPATVVVAMDGERMEVGDLECGLSGVDFECVGELSTAVSGADAILTERYRLAGAWVSDHEFSGNMQFGLSCAGADCSSVASSQSLPVPCSAEASVAGEYEE